ncbi:MAG TPA: helix-turn-helix transcriptional regulator [Thermoanaerobaculia bacterium]
MDLVLKLRELRRMSGLSQKELAKKAGIGEKTISSFETGQRIDSLKVSQLRRILAAHGVSESEFFSSSFDRRIAPWEEGDGAQQLVDDLQTLPSSIQESLLAKFRLMIETASEVHAIDHSGSSRKPIAREESNWQMLTSRN